ncbi:GtrA family protein [Streptomyces cacaoi]
MKSLTSFARFVVFGGGTGVLSSLAVPLLAVLMPWTLSNALITIASTVLCTELHARYTFRTGRRAGLRRHWQSAGSAAAAYAATSVAVFALHAIQPTPGMLTEQLVYLSASGLAGIARFAILRLFVFATGTDRDTTKTKTMKIKMNTTTKTATKTATKTTDTNEPIKATTITRPRRTPAPAAGLTAALSPS